MKKVLVLCSHEPERDPRIHWIAGFAPADVECTVVGFHDPSRPRSALEKAGRYSIVRLASSHAHWVRDLIFVGETLLRNVDAWSKIKIILSLAAAFPFVVMYQIVVFGLSVPGRVWRWIRRSLFSGMNTGQVPEPGDSNLLIGAWRWCRERVLNHPVSRRFSSFKWLAMHVIRVSAVLLKYAKDAGPFDVVHANDFDTLVAGTALKLAKGWRLVYDAHEYWPHSDVAATGLERKLWAGAEGVFARFADAAFTVSKPLAQFMESAYGRPFGVLPNCEPMLASQVAAEGRRQARPLSVVYIGTFAPERGIEEVIQAWKSLVNGEAELYLHGPDNECKAACMAIAGVLGILGKTVHFPAPVHETELVKAASRYDVGLIPYKPITVGYRFCCPNKLSQYMQAGLAILANDLPNVVNIVRHYGCGVVYDVSRPNTLADEVRRLAIEEGALLKMKERSSKAALADFNWQVQSRGLYETYKTSNSNQIE